MVWDVDSELVCLHIKVTLPGSPLFQELVSPEGVSLFLASKTF